jgi:hypothetical protein
MMGKMNSQPTVRSPRKAHRKTGSAFNPANFAHPVHPVKQASLNRFAAAAALEKIRFGQDIIGKSPF